MSSSQALVARSPAIRLSPVLAKATLLSDPAQPRYQSSRRGDRERHERKSILMQVKCSATLRSKPWAKKRLVENRVNGCICCTLREDICCWR